MNLLTPEEREAVERLREKVVSPMGYNPLTQSASREAINQERARSRQLLAIIDNLSQRAPKQYTEQELRDHCKAQNRWMLDGPSCYSDIENTWIEAARKFGALKADI